MSSLKGVFIIVGEIGAQNNDKIAFGILIK